MGPTLKQLRPRRRQNEQSDAAAAVKELIEEVEEAFVRPVQVFEDEHERALVCERLKEVAPSGERLPTGPGRGGGAAAEADASAQPRRDALRLEPLCAHPLHLRLARALYLVHRV